MMRLLLLLLLCGFGLAGAPLRAQAPRPVLVLAAASLQEAMSDAADAWSRGGRPRPVVSFAASSALARQIAAGARADLFVSADEAWMDDLQRRGLIWPGSRARLLTNGLVLVAPARDSARVPLGQLPARLGEGRLAMADPQSVPAGRYAKAALDRLRLWQAVERRVVRAENVRAALALVERGVARYGIVYATDARASARVRVAAAFPTDSHPPITYPIARLRASTSPDAERFRRFLLSPAGQAIFARHGFGVR